MPVRNITIDNTNPLINYQPPGAWNAGDIPSAPDSLANQYQNSTFTTCTTGGTATLNFNGTSVWIFGAKRGNHGNYSVSLDGQSPLMFSGLQADPGSFQFPLYFATGLTQGPHKVVVTNVPIDSNHPWFDIDFITWQTQYGGATESSTDALQEDDNSAWSYSPASSWSTDVSQLPGFSSGSGHATFTDGSSATYRFNGDTISIYGAVGPAAAPYTVSLDGGPVTTYNGTELRYYPQSLLYYADNLGPGNHMVNLVAHPAGFGQALSIDYAIASSVASVAAGPLISASSSAGASTTGGKTVTGASPSGTPIGTNPLNPTNAAAATYGSTMARGVMGGLSALLLSTYFLSFA